MAHVEKRGQGRWRVRYRAPDGRERSKTFERQGDAKRWLAELEVAQGRGEWVDPRLGRTTFADWYRQWEGTVVDLRASTLDRDSSFARTHLLPAFGAAPLARISKSDVRRFVAAKAAAGELAPATVRKMGQVLSKIMAAAVDEGLIARSPCDGVKLPAETQREMRFLAPSQIHDLAEALDGHYRTLAVTAAYTGLRWGELAALRPDRVDPLRRKVAVLDTLNEVNGKLSIGPPKTPAARRTVDVPAFLAGMLAEQIAERAVEGVVFPSEEGMWMRRSNFRRRAWLPAIGAAGLEGLRFHDLRHTAVALAIGEGAHPKAIQEMMGHSSIKVTLDRYGHLFPALGTQIAERLDAVWRDSSPATAAPVLALR